MKEILTIIIPVVRPDKADRCVKAIEDNAGIPEGTYRIVVKQDDLGIGCPKMVDEMVQEVKTPLVMFLGDDTIPKKNFLAIALDTLRRKVKSFDEPVLIGLGDGTENGRTFATHWMASMKLLDHLPDRQFFHTSYNHCFSDYELTDHAKELDCYVWNPHAEVFHDHPMFDRAEGDDPHYERIYADDVYMADRENFWVRKRKRLTNGERLDRIGIAEPNISGKIDREYHRSFILMEKPSEFIYLIPDRDTLDFIEDWSRIRNNLVIQAMNDAVTLLVMLDTDQEYALNVISLLLNNSMWERSDTAIVGGLVYKRHKPYDAVIRRGEDPDSYESPSEDVRLGETIEVDAIGTGCVAIDTKVFFGTQSIYPWFKEVRSGKGKRISEDFNFSYKLRRMGYRIYCDTGTEITHWTRMGVNRHTWEVLQKFKN